MDLIMILLIVLVILAVVGGIAWSPLLWILVAAALIILVFRLRR